MVEVETGSIEQPIHTRVGHMRVPRAYHRHYVVEHNKRCGAECLTVQELTRLHDAVRRGDTPESKFRVATTRLLAARRRSV